MARVVLPVLRLEVAHIDGVEVYDPNSILFASIAGVPDAWRPIQGMSPDDVGGSGSVISGKPAVIYRTRDKQIPLAPDELRRLVLHDLSAEEFARLRDIFGLFFEIHEDFYCPTTGEALQPVG